MDKLLFFFFVASLGSCSTTKVLEAWKANDNVTLQGKNTLVVARTANENARKAFEKEIADKMRSKGLSATESYTEFPDLKPNEKLTEAEVKEAKENLKKDGYDAVVLTVLKDKKLTVERNLEGGYYSGATFATYYPAHYYNFYGYWGHPTSFSMNYGGNYTDPEMQVQESITYIVETVVFDLNATEKDQLIAVVSASIEDPQYVGQTAKVYSKKVAAALKK